MVKNYNKEDRDGCLKKAETKIGASGSDRFAGNPASSYDEGKGAGHKEFPRP